MRFDCDKCGDTLPQVDLVCASCDAHETYDQDRLVKESDGSYVYEMRDGNEKLLSRVNVTCECGDRHFEMQSATLCPGCTHMLEKELQA